MLLNSHFVCLLFLFPCLGLVLIDIHMLIAFGYEDSRCFWQFWLLLLLCAHMSTYLINWNIQHAFHCQKGQEGEEGGREMCRKYKTQTEAEQ